MILTVKRNEQNQFSLKDVIFIPCRDFYFVVNVKEIMYIKAEKSYCKIIHNSGKEYLLVSGLKTLLDKLPDYFVRTHHSYVINLYHTHSIHNKKIVKLNNDYEIPISRRKIKLVFELLTIA